MITNWLCSRYVTPMYNHSEEKEIQNKNKHLL